MTHWQTPILAYTRALQRPFPTGRNLCKMFKKVCILKTHRLFSWLPAVRVLSVFLDGLGYFLGFPPPVRHDSGSVWSAVIKMNSVAACGSGLFF